MANIKTEGEIIKVKGSKFMYCWVATGTWGGIVSCLILLFNGLKFESNYSLFYIGGGIGFLPFCVYLTLWHLPGFKPGKVLFTIVPGEEGKIVTKKHTVPIKQIREIDLIRNPINLINDIVIKTYDQKVVKIRTYNLLDDLDFFRCIDDYIYPYMTAEGKAYWDQKINQSEILKEEGFERKNHKVE